MGMGGNRSDERRARGMKRRRGRKRRKGHAEREIKTMALDDDRANW